MEMWLTRDENQVLSLHTYKPRKFGNKWVGNWSLTITKSGVFPEVQWSDAEPTKVKLVIEK